MKGLVIVIAVAMFICSHANSTATATVQGTRTMSALFRVGSSSFLKESIETKYSIPAMGEYHASLWELWDPIRPRKVTAYASIRKLTSKHPFLTASAERVRYGIVAANFLPFGKRIQIPTLFGDQIFIVKDRMHPRFKDRVDIWMPRLAKAKKFGIRSANVVVLD